MTILLFIAGLSLSSIAAVYAIIGLLSIFPAAPITIIIMGSALEASKLIVASWMYRNWKEIPVFLKTYFSIAIVVLMLLTSMSIFGFLSKAHFESGMATGESVAALSIVDEKIATQKENIMQSKKALTQMDAQVNEMLSRTTDEKGTDKAIRARSLQKKERGALSAEIAAAQLEISKLQSERTPLASTVRKVEAEVGPIRYIANLIYGDKIDDTILEKAVRIVILLIVFVFDPLAVLILIAANWNLKHHELIRTTITNRHIETVEDVTTTDTEEFPADDQFLHEKDYLPIKLNPIPQEKLEAFRNKLKVDENKDVQDESKIDEVKTEAPILLNSDNNYAHVPQGESNDKEEAASLPVNIESNEIKESRETDTIEVPDSGISNEQTIAVASMVNVDDQSPKVLKNSSLH